MGSLYPFTNQRLLKRNNHQQSSTGEKNDIQHIYVVFLEIFMCFHLQIFVFIKINSAYSTAPLTFGGFHRQIRKVTKLG